MTHELKKEGIEQETNVVSIIYIGRVKSELKEVKGWVWPRHIMQLILEQLHNSTKPSAIALNIESHARLMAQGREVVVHELPSLAYIRRYSKK